MDEERREDDYVEVCPRGMCFESSWQWTLGTQLGVTFCSCADPAQTIRAEGIVVECERHAARAHRVTLLFLEAAPELTARLFSAGGQSLSDLDFAGRRF